MYSKKLKARSQIIITELTNNTNKNLLHAHTHKMFIIATTEK